MKISLSHWRWCSAFPQEMVQALHDKHDRGNVMIKVNMAKAYDRVDRNVLKLVMKGFDFSYKVIRLILDCVKTP